MTFWLIVPALSEAQEELQAQILTRGVEEGRSLLDGVSGPLVATNSLAHELSQMSDDEVSTYQSSTCSIPCIFRTRIVFTYKQAKAVSIRKYEECLDYTRHCKDFFCFSVHLLHTKATPVYWLRHQTKHLKLDYINPLLTTAFSYKGWQEN